MPISGPTLAEALRCLGAALLLCAAACPAAQGQHTPAIDAASGQVACSAAITSRHNPELADVEGHGLCFAGYISKFGPWHDAGTPSGVGAWGIPQWTIHRVDARRLGRTAAEGRARPRDWFSISALRAARAAPVDADYRLSKAFRESHRIWYDRGHLTQKYVAERLGGQAGWYTHNLVNAVPQRARFNQGPWLTLECFTGAWGQRERIGVDHHRACVRPGPAVAAVERA